MADFKFPDVGEGIQEGEVVKWLVKVGDVVKANQNIVQVETDKSVVDLPAPEAGKIANIAVKEGQKVKVGGTLCTIGSSSAGSTKPPIPSKAVASAKTSKPAKPSPAKQEPEESSESKSVSVHAMPSLSSSKQPSKEKTSAEGKGKNRQKRGLAVVGQLEEAPDENPTPPQNPNETVEGVEYKSHASTMRGESQSKKVKTSPAIRQLAREHNINLAKLKGSGPDGRILRSDLSISQRVPQQIIPVTKLSTPSGSAERVPLKGIRKAISDNMTLSHQIPQATEMEDVDITRLWKIREKEKKKYKDVHLTLLAFIVKAATSVLKENPSLNAYLDIEKQEILMKKYYNIGIAVETPLGLMVPNIKNADEKPIADIAREIQDLAQRARDRKISMEDMRNGTFTITNYGSIGGTYATPLINPGESAILGVGRIFEQPSPKDFSKKSKILPLSLTFDHRIVDGAQAARFLETLKMYLEDPNHLFVEL